MVNVIGIAVPKIVALLIIWIPSYGSNAKIILTGLCILKFIWNCDRSRPSHKGLIYKLTAKASIGVQETIVSIIGLALAVLFAVVAVKYGAWIPTVYGALSVVIWLISLFGNLKDIRK